jgi:hypothetical protein
LARGVLEQRGELLGFRHDLIREALYHDIPRRLPRYDAMNKIVTELNNLRDILSAS